MLSNRRRDEKAPIRGRERHEITPVYRLLVVQIWQAWQLHDPRRENSRSKLQNVVTDSTPNCPTGPLVLERLTACVVLANRGESS